MKKGLSTNFFNIFMRKYQMNKTNIVLFNFLMLCANVFSQTHKYKKITHFYPSLLSPPPLIVQLITASTFQ